MEASPHSKQPYLGSIVFAVAVIAIVLFSGLPAAVKLVDRTRYQEDLKTAEAMTLAIKDSINPVTETSYDAYDVKTIVRETLGEDFSFVPRTNNAGYFFVEQSKQVIVVRYRDAVQASRVFDSFEYRTDLLSIGDSVVVRSPEEVLGEGIYFLGGSGQWLTDTINFIRSLTDQEDMNTIYVKKIDLLEKASSGIMNTIYEYGADDVEIQLARRIYDAFDPSSTLFVDDEGWHTEAMNSEVIHTIVLKEGILNIPAFDLGDQIDFSLTPITLDEVIVPKTVQNIESGAFAAAYFEIGCLVIKSIDGLYVQYQALVGVKSVERDVFMYQVQLVDFSDFLNFVVNDDEISLNISDNQDIFINNQITGYQIFSSQGFMFAYLYSSNILFGYATNTYVVEYIVEDQGLYPYHIQIQINPMFVLPTSPRIPNLDFVGWRHGKNIVVNQVGVSSHNTFIYADYS